MTMGKKIDIASRKISNKRREELENLPDFYVDMPKEYLCCKPIYIFDWLKCSADEYYVIDRLCHKHDNEMGWETWCFFFVYGIKHFFFYIKWDEKDEYYDKYYAHSVITVLPNEFLDSNPNKSVFLEIIRDYLVLEFGLNIEYGERKKYKKGVVVYEGERL